MAGIIREVNVWLHHEDADGRSYFYNSVTEQSVWELPNGENDWLECKDPSTGSLFWHNAYRDISIWEHPRNYEAEKWTECVDASSGRVFYYNVSEGRSVWHKPDDSLLVSSRPRKETETSCETEGEVEEGKEDCKEVFDASAALPDGEFHDYVLKEGGGSSMFGRKSWKRRFLVLKHGEIGWFKSFKAYVSGALPLKGRWTSLSGYRLEESLADSYGLRLLPLSSDEGERRWNLRCESEEKKHKLIAAMSSFVVSKSFVKNLERHLSSRRFTTDFH